MPQHAYPIAAPKPASEPALVAKTQQVRVLDVAALGPFMIWAGARRGELPAWARFALTGSGVLAITYNSLRFREQAAGAPPVPAWIMGAQPGLAIALAAVAGVLAARGAQ